MQKELYDKCKKLIDLVSYDLITNCKAQDAEVFLQKMKGDFFRYQAENAEGAQKKDAINNCKKAYRDAYELSKGCLSAIHPMRLGIVLNFSVFHYEITGKVRDAYLLAKEGFDLGMDALDETAQGNQQFYKDSNLNLKCLIDNMQLGQEEFSKTNEFS